MWGEPCIINWGVLDHASLAPQLIMSCNYMHVCGYAVEYNIIQSLDGHYELLIRIHVSSGLLDTVTVEPQTSQWS